MMSTGILTLVVFILTLGVLIAFHEFGHFSIARLCNVHVIRFSIGFGKPLFKLRDKKGTEYVIAAFPFGGYVKMLGESDQDKIPEGLKHLSFCGKSVWIRMLIAIAGPLFNFFLAVIALWAMFMIGTVSLAPIVGTVAPHSIAEQAHLHHLDEIMSVDDKSVNTWQDVQMALISAVGEEKKPVLRLYNLQTRLYNFASLDLHDMHFEQANNNEDLVTILGITPALPPMPPIIEGIYKNSPGEIAGFEVGDRIIKMDGKPVDDWMQVVSVVQERPDERIDMVVQRKKQLKTLEVYPEAKEISTAHGKEIIGFLGIEAKPPANLKEIWLRTERYSAWSAIVPAFHETGVFIQMTLKMMWKLLTGALSLHTISGPIGMAQLASQAVSLGWASYFSFIALISVSLGVLNLLPIPILDGGHLLYGVFEVILRRPLSEKTRLNGVRLGVFLLGALMLLAIFNDLSRFYLS